MVRFSISMVSSWNVSRTSSASMRSLSAFASLIGSPVRSALAQAVSQRDAFVEHKTVTAPAALVFRHALQISQDAALEMVDLGKAAREQIGAGLFASDTAGTEHRDLPVLCRIEMLGGEFLELAKAPDTRIDRAFKGPHRDLEGVAGIDHERVGGRDQRVPVRGIDIGADLSRR